MEFDQDWRGLLEKIVQGEKGRFRYDVSEEITNVIRGFDATNKLFDLEVRAQRLVYMIQKGAPNELVNVDDEFLPLLKTFVVKTRLMHANEVEALREKTTHPHILSSLEERLKPYDAVLARLRHVKPEQVPRLSEYLTMEQLAVRGAAKLGERTYDEKFHILQAPPVLYADLSYYREACALRGADISVVFLDIDDFKKFNSEVGETAVDRFVLPPFMRLLESLVYVHGHAYRFGGDEYAVLLPNAGEELSIYFLRKLRKQLEKLQFDQVKTGLTVSMGMCVMRPDCWLTNREVVQRAERAKNHAKKSGKDCVSNYSTENFEESDLKKLLP